MKEEDLATLLASMLRDLPRVSVKKHVGHASFRVGKKVFAFTRNQGVAVKLPREKIRELVNKQNAAPLVMGIKSHEGMGGHPTQILKRTQKGLESL